MNWKEKLYILEKNDDFDVAIFFMQRIIRDHPEDVDAYIFILFRLMYCIIENSCHFANISQTPVSDIKKQYYSEKEEDYHDLYLEYFAQGNEKFSENPEFLFYAAHTAAMACGLSFIYAGVDDVFINKMMEKAALLDPHNMVYQWQFYPAFCRDNDLQDQKLLDYAQSVLDQNSPIWQELHQKGSFGEHLYGIMESWAHRMLKE
jgi:hypothetical protein